MQIYSVSVEYARILKKMRKNLHGSEKCCTFATAFEKIAMVP